MRKIWKSRNRRSIIMGKIKQLIEDHPNIWEFIKFNVLSLCNYYKLHYHVAVYRFYFQKLCKYTI
mgnify:CR=1 FL=1